MNDNINRLEYNEFVEKYIEDTTIQGDLDEKTTLTASMPEELGDYDLNIYKEEEE